MDRSIAQASLFILSFGDRDRLTAMANALGAHAVGARRLDDLEERLASLRPEVVIVDAGQSISGAIEGVGRAAPIVAARGGAVVVLLTAFDGGLARRFLDAGATGYHVGPVSDAAALAAIVGYARRGAARRGRGRSASWRWRRGSDALVLDPAVSERFAIDDGANARAALRRLDTAVRRGLLGAVRRAAATGSAVFAHADGESGERIVHHVRATGGEIVAWIEQIGEAGGDGGALAPAKEARALIEAAIAARPTTLAVVGISRLDAINAALGEQAGDLLLRTAGQRIAGVVTAIPGAVAARLPGADFLVCRPAMASDAALGFGRMLSDAIGRPVASGDGLLATPAHIGLATSEAGSDDPVALLQRATAALADARLGGGSRVRVAGDADVARDEAVLEIDLRRALAEDQIEILFQPQVSIADARIVGAEALARWRHPLRGELDAATLFGVAARSDYVDQLSGHIQRRALAQVAAWPAELAHLRVALNVTAGDLARAGFVAEMEAMTRDAGLAAARITLEVTEETLIDDLGEASARLARLRAAGFRTAIDDFGTGFSSLAYLKALPLDTLKIDRQLIADLSAQPRDRIVVVSAIQLARSLGLVVIAEGVERTDQLELLAEAGCNLYQGFLCSAPIDDLALARLVAAG